MEISSTQPSSKASAFKQQSGTTNPNTTTVADMEWDTSLDEKAVFDILEQDFYPFKKVKKFSLMYLLF